MLFLAIRQLLNKKRQTILTLLGIVLGSAAYVGISGMMLGFQQFMIDRLVNNDAHVRIQAREDIITERSLDDDFFPDHAKINLGINWVVPPSGRRDQANIEYPQGWFERLNAHPEVMAYSPQLKVQAIARRGKITSAISLIGSDPIRQSLVTNIDEYMISGKFTDIGSSGNRILVGDGLLQHLGARASETLFISVGKSEPTPFKVVGVFHLGIKTIDDSTVFASLADVQKVNQTPSQLSDIAVKLTSVERAFPLAEQWALTSRDKVQSWEQTNEGILSVFKTQDIVRNSMTVSILIVAGFGIYNILSMAVYQRRKEIAILRSIGYEPHDIINLFLSQGVILGTLGGIFGLIAGYIICLWLETIPVSSQRMIGSGTMMVSFDKLIYIKAFLLAFVSSTFAAYLPARAAGKMTPIDIIRSEGS